MIIVKKFNPDKIMTAMTLAVFALLLADAYLSHRKEIDESIAKLKTALNDGSTAKGETENA